jgi:hypothetical protein
VLAATGPEGHVARDMARMYGLALRMLRKYPELGEDNHFQEMVKIPLTRLIITEDLRSGLDATYVAEFARAARGSEAPSWVRSARKEAKARVAALTVKPKTATASGAPRREGKRGRWKKNGEKKDGPNANQSKN